MPAARIARLLSTCEKKYLLGPSPPRRRCWVKTASCRTDPFFILLMSFI